MILRPLALGPWHSGIPHIYVSRARMGVDFGTVGFVPGDIPLAEAARLVGDAADTRELREALGGRIHDDIVEFQADSCVLFVIRPSRLLPAVRHRATQPADAGGATKPVEPPASTGWVSSQTTIPLKLQ